MPVTVNDALLSFTFLQPDETGVSLIQEGSNMHNFVGVLAGPPNTPYNGGSFKVALEIGDRFPYRPPQVSACMVICIVLFTIPCTQARRGNGLRCSLLKSPRIPAVLGILMLVGF